MGTSGDAEQQAPSVADAPARFGEQLRALFAEAGSPTLAATVNGAAKLSPGRSDASVQRLSDWRRGRHLPARFETLEPVLAWLILQAQSKGADEITGLPEWQRRWQAAREPAKASRVETPPIAPYRGLSTMTDADKDVFFGRDRVLDQLADLIEAAHRERADTPAVVIVTGVSGAGKSSLLRAGIARLASGSGPDGQPRRWSATVGLAVGLAAGEPESGQPESGSAHLGASASDDLESPPRGENTEPRQVIESVDDPVITVHVVDQIEQVLVGESLHSEGVRRLTESLVELASRDGHVVVVGARADMYEKASVLEPLATAWQRRSIVVPPMSDDELDDVIAAPARLAGIRVDKGLTPTILSDLRSLSGQRGPVEDRAGQLPLVAHVLSVMWAGRGRGSLTVAGYHAAGGVASAISATAEKLWASLDPAAQLIAERLLLSLIHASGGVIARRPRTLEDLVRVGDDRSETVTVIEALSESRLITVSDQQVQIIHDVVLTAWPRLVELIDRVRDLAPVIDRVESDAAEWDRQDRDAVLLYNPTRYAWASQVSDDPILPAVARDYLEASRRNIDAARRRRRLGIAAVALLAVISVVAAIVAIASNAALTRESDDARFSALLSTSGRLAQTDPGLAAHLSLGAWRTRPNDPLARMRLLQTQQLPLPTPARQAHTGSIYDMVLNRSKSLLATASYDNTVRLWSTANPEQITAVSKPLGGYQSFVTSADLNPVGDRLASADGSGHITVWDTTDPATPAKLQTLTSPFGSGTSYILRYDRTGRVLVSTHDNGAVTIWDTTNPAGYQAVAAVRGFSGPVRTLAVSDVAPIVAVGSDDGTIGVVDIADPRAPRMIARIADGVDSGWHAVAISPNGRLLAAGRDDGTVAIWSLATPQAPAELGQIRAHDAAIWSVSFSADGQSLITAGLDGVARRWDVATDGDVASPNLLTALGVPMRTAGGAFFVAQELQPHTILTAGGSGTIQAWDIPRSPIPAHTLPITRTSVSPDGHTLATSGADQKIILWDLSGDSPRELSRIRRPPRPSGGYVAAFDRSGTLLATAFTGGGEVELYDISDRSKPEMVATLNLDTRHAFPLSFAPDRDMLVTGSADNTLQLWDTSDRARPRAIGAPFPAAEGFVEDVDFAPDGSSLAVADARHRITRLVCGIQLGLYSVYFCCGCIE